MIFQQRVASFAGMFFLYTSSLIRRYAAKSAAEFTINSEGSYWGQNTFVKRKKGQGEKENVKGNARLLPQSALLWLYSCYCSTAILMQLRLKNIKKG